METFFVIVVVVLIMTIKNRTFSNATMSSQKKKIQKLSNHFLNKEHENLIRKSLKRTSTKNFTFGQNISKFLLCTKNKKACYGFRKKLFTTEEVRRNLLWLTWGWRRARLFWWLYKASMLQQAWMFTQETMRHLHQVWRCTWVVSKTSKKN